MNGNVQRSTARTGIVMLKLVHIVLFLTFTKLNCEEGDTVDSKLATYSVYNDL